MYKNRLENDRKLSWENRAVKFNGYSAFEKKEKFLPNVAMEWPNLWYSYPPWVKEISWSKWMSNCSSEFLIYIRPWFLFPGTWNPKKYFEKIKKYFLENCTPNKKKYPKIA